MRILWSEPAVADLEAINDYISRDSPQYAMRFVQRLIEAAERLTELPRVGRVVPEGDGEHREVLESPYRIVYRVEANDVYVIGVVHGARDLAALWEDLETDR